ncbi:ATP-dependent zinc metalloprotease FTSH 10, mitochondrial-like [Lotus japonicus]|uniref:ATP-dependent zinc metalloprotease FTSH 10, mitochondrial-like n=1 Tax=Lotus japonicus TaxID=34305 RepID=UPI002584463F|nr:ATP-dependent zinc metalloprotease FTSH 10, mitochondrial-like [Lotus japonicus]
MIFSRIGRSLSRSSRARNLFCGDGRLGTLGVSSRTNVAAEGGLGFFRGYASSVGAARSSGSLLSNLAAFKSVAANPRLHHRLFSSEAPKKNYENFYPKEKKDAPKGNGNNDKKYESKDESNTNSDEQGNFQETFMKQFQNLLTPLLVMGLFFSSFSFGPREQQQVYNVFGPSPDLAMAGALYLSSFPRVLTLG